MVLRVLSSPPIRGVALMTVCRGVAGDKERKYFQNAKEIPTEGGLGGKHWFLTKSDEDANSAHDKNK